jgi:HK97 family phage prohead protease
MQPDGCVLTNYRKNPIVLADHDRTKPIGNAEVVVRNGALEALITFAPHGASEKADEYCALAKAGVLSAVSIGFMPIEMQPIKGGGLMISKWELLEISMVAIPANADALVIARSFGKAGRVLSGANAAKLKTAHDLAEQCRAMVKDVLDGADCGDDDEDCDDDDAKAARLRQVEVLSLNTEPYGDRTDRQREVRDLEVEGLR